MVDIKAAPLVEKLKIWEKSFWQKFIPDVQFISFCECISCLEIYHTPTNFEGIYGRKDVVNS